jgi:hypothetical protein
MKKSAITFALVCCFGVAIQGQTSTDKAKAIAAQLQTLVDELKAALEPTPTPTPSGPTVFHVATSVELLAARDASKPGDEIRAKVGPGIFYSVLTLTKKDAPVTLRPDVDDADLPPALWRSTANALDGYADRMVTIQPPLNEYGIKTEPGASNWRVVAVRVTSPGPDGTCVGLGDATPMPSTVEALPHDITFESLLCDGGDNAKRGVSLNGNALTLIYSVVKGIRQPTLNNDTQAVTCYNGGGPFTIVGNYLSAAGETVLFGGSDPKIANLVPSNIEIRGNVITKDLAWKGTRNQVKNLLELKNARHVTIAQNRLEYSWADAQDGTAVLFTIRNQEGGCPWCTVEDVDWGFNVVAHAANGLSILGHDDCGPAKDCSGSPPRPSGRVTNIRIHDSLWYDLGTGPYSKVGDSTFGWSINDGVVGLTVERNTMIGKYSTLLKLSPGRTKTASVGLAFRNNVLSEGKYAVIADGLAAGLASWVPAVVDATSAFENNLLARTAADNYKYAGVNVKSGQGEAVVDVAFVLLPKFVRDGLGCDLKALPAF